MIRLPRHTRAMLGRMAEFWVNGTGPTALLLLLVAPYIVDGQPIAVILAYLALPAFMLHQVEEYDAGLVRRTVEGLLGPQPALLSLGQVAIINLGLAWLPLALGLWLVMQADPGWAVLAAWLMLLNGALHLGQAAIQGRYNPGVVTAMVLFFPLGSAIMVSVPAAKYQHVAAALCAVLVHLMIIAVGRAKPSSAA